MTSEIQAKDITFEVKEKTIIQEFSGEFSSGHLYVFSGDSGCGKTTLLSILAKIVKPTKGKVLYSPNLKSDSISFASENTLSILDFTAYDNLSLYCKDKDMIEEALACVGLSKQRDEKASKLSKGENARLALARMILQKKEVLFFDEPTANLDEENKQHVFSILRELSKTRIVIIASHDCDCFKAGDIIYKYMGNNTFQQIQIQTEREKDETISLPDSAEKGRKEHLTFLESWRLFLSVLKRCIKQMFVLVPLTCFLLYAFVNISVLVCQSPNRILSENMDSSKIVGTIISSCGCEDNTIYEGTYALADETMDCILLSHDSNSIEISQKTYTIEHENGIILPSCYTCSNSFTVGDTFYISVFGIEKEFFIEDIYPTKEIKTEGLFKGINQAEIQALTLVNNPILISYSQRNLIKQNECHFYYCLTSDLKKKDIVNSKPQILDFVDVNTRYFLENKKDYDRTFFYFLLAISILLFISLYFLSTTLVKAFSQELDFFRYTDGTNRNSNSFFVFTGSILVFAMALISGVITGLTTHGLNHFIRRFFYFKTLLQVFSFNWIPLCLLILSFVVCMIVLFLLNIANSIFALHQLSKRKV